MGAMALLPLQLNITLTSKSRLKTPYFHLSSRVPAPLFSSANATDHPANDVVLNATPSTRYAEEGSIVLPQGLLREMMPRHVAIIMDGNRRWARMRGLPVGLGYEAGFRAFRRIMDLCCRWEIRVLTVFAFSSDNWFRPKVETNLLMGLFEKTLRDQLLHLVRKDIRVSLIGDTSKLLKPLQVLLTDAVETTKNNSRLHLIIAVNYSGQNDLVQACQKLALKVKDGLIEPDDINEFSVERELETNCTDFPCPDLLIRTSGELRISNFLLWQLAYTELYFANSLWPDFGEVEFLEALCSFQKRQRRYGGRSY